MAALRIPIRRRKTEPEQTPTEVRPGGKGRATPKRSEAVKSRPVTPYMNAGTGSRRENSKNDRARRRAMLDGQRAALRGEGDVSKLPPRDKRPEAAFVRDYVDHRRNLVTLVLLAYGLLFLNFVLHGAYIVITLLLAIVFLAIVDAFVLGFTVKRMVRRQFPGSKEKIAFYAVQRATLPRRFRNPRMGVGIPPPR